MLHRHEVLLSITTNCKRVSSKLSAIGSDAVTSFATGASSDDCATRYRLRLFEDCVHDALNGLTLRVMHISWRHIRALYITIQVRCALIVKFKRRRSSSLGRLMTEHTLVSLIDVQIELAIVHVVFSPVLRVVVTVLVQDVRSEVLYRSFLSLFLS